MQRETPASERLPKLRSRIRPRSKLDMPPQISTNPQLTEAVIGDVCNRVALQHAERCRSRRKQVKIGA